MRRRIWILLIVAMSICSCGKVIDESIETVAYNIKDRFIVLGDSVSYGTGSRHHHSWAAIIQDSLHFKSFWNLSVPGAVASSKTSDGKYDLATQICEIDTDDNFITVMIGINDCTRNKEIGDVEAELLLPVDELDYKQSFSQGFIYDLKILKEKCPKSLVVVVGPPEISKNPSNNLTAYIEVERRVAENLGFPFIDLSAAPYSSLDSSLCGDHIHPTDKGYKILAIFILPRLKQILMEYDEKEKHEV